NFHGGFYTPSDFTGDIHKFTNGLARACERLGVTMRLATEVTHVAATDVAVRISSRSVEPSTDETDAPVRIDRFDQVV
ncbi:FAD-dependent oxidoreductase, partial [Klebsiella pneumoniae]|uniref:FAD-dependent oxidoreductase n=1 Tax=Klebsiella pneumoniae TaxID=573 RepID=UPI0013D1F745